MSLLGDDGRGFELARRLESCGVWRSWLGDSLYATFVHSLTSPSSWEAFIRTDDSKTRAQIQLQLRARALLFDKASISLFLRSNTSSSSSSSSTSAPVVSVSKLNPAYLQLHGDDVYYTLDDSSQDGTQQRDNGVAASKSQAKAAHSVGLRYSESDIEKSQRFRQEELPETWYNQFIEKYRVSKPYKPSFGDSESNKRTPEEMSTYLRLLEKHKRRRVAFKDDQYMGYGNSILESAPNMHKKSGLDTGNSADEDTSFFPETMFTFNSVPDSALPPSNRAEDGRKVEFFGIFDTLPQVTSRSPVMIERLGIRPEYLGMEQGGGIPRGKNGSEGNRKCLSQEQASKISQKILTRMLAHTGFEGTTEVPLEVFSQVLGSHICKLGHRLKVLADSYRKQCSAIELLKMFLQVSGYSNFAVLAEHVKDGTRSTIQQTPSVQQMNFTQQTPQQVNGLQTQLQPQHQSSVRLPQQITRQMHPQMQQMVHSQNLAFQQQQQLERMRRRQQSTPRPGNEMDKDRSPMVQVKLENPPDLPLDNNVFNSVNNRHQQMQYRQQQQFPALSNLHAQSANQFRQMANLQIPQIQNQNMGAASARAPPVKVEGFQELMGGDSSLKHDSEENKMTSPST